MQDDTRTLLPLILMATVSRLDSEECRPRDPRHDSIAGPRRFDLRGTKSNRDGIGARVDVNGQVQYLSAGSGFLSQHSKRLHFGLAGQPTAHGEDHLAVRRNAGIPQPRSWPRLHHRRRPILTRRSVPFKHALFLQPPPSPERTHPNSATPGCWNQSRRRRNVPPASPARLLDIADKLKAEKPEVAATFSLFRRYLFEYRQDLSLPLVLLVDAESRAHKVYANIPTAAQMRTDFARITESRKLALPFPGKYYLQPRRNYFKLGSAFHWAGYPDRALPYLAETLRTLPNNWKALLAMARIQLELGRNQDALASFKEVIEIKNDYPPAFLGAGEAYAKLADNANAQHMFEVAPSISIPNAPMP